MRPKNLGDKLAAITKPTAKLSKARIRMELALYCVETFMKSSAASKDQQVRAARARFHRAGF